MKHPFLIFIFLVPLFSNSQPIKPLAIGDPVPAFAFSNTIIHFNNDSAKLSTVSSKLLILDFWSTWCTSCLQSFPKLQTLQQQFKQDLQVVLVNSKNTGDNSKKINNFFAKRKNYNGQPYSFPGIIEDTILTQLFAHKLIPHYVWIDQHRVVKAITGAEDINSENITAIISGTASAMRTKTDLDVDLTAPLFIKANGGEGENLIHRSLLTGYSPGLPSFTGSAPAGNGPARIYAVNASVENLYKLAHPALNAVSANRIILEARQPEHYRLTGDPDIWKYKHAFTYELSVPVADTGRLQWFMQKDLERYFGMQLTKQKREISCWVITKNAGDRASPVKKQSKNKNTHRSPGTQQMPLAVLVENLDYASAVPVINETGLADFCVDWSGSYKDTEKIKQELQQNGFLLSEACRMVEVFVLTEKIHTADSLSSSLNLLSRRNFLLDE